MDDLYLDLSNEMAEISQLNTISASLARERHAILENGMERETALALENTCPGIFGDYNVDKFTKFPSQTGIKLAVEKIDWKKGGLIALALGAGIALIAKIIEWIKKGLKNLGLGAKDINRGKKNERDLTRKVAQTEPDDFINPDNVSDDDARFVIEKGIVDDPTIRNRYTRALAYRISKDKNISMKDAHLAIVEYIKIHDMIDIGEHNKRFQALIGASLLSGTTGTPIDFPLAMNAIAWGHHESDGSMVNYDSIKDASILIKDIIAFAKSIKQPLSDILNDLKSGVVVNEAITKLFNDYSIAFTKFSDGLANSTIIKPVSEIEFQDGGIFSSRFGYVPSDNISKATNFLKEKGTDRIGIWTIPTNPGDRPMVISMQYFPSMMKDLAVPGLLEEFAKLYSALYTDKGELIGTRDMDAIDDAIALIKKIQEYLSKNKMLDQEFSISISGTEMVVDITGGELTKILLGGFTESMKTYRDVMMALAPILMHIKNTAITIMKAGDYADKAAKWSAILK